MALAQTSLDIDLLTVATLYNRGSIISSGISYAPVVSTFGAFSKWNNVPIKDLFSPVFYSYSNGDIFINTISSIAAVNNSLSSSLYLNTDLFSSFLSTNYANLLVSSNIGFSTLSSYDYKLLLNSTVISTLYSSINGNFSTITPGISTTYSTFYDTVFSPQASTLIEQGIYYYINRDRIGEFTYDMVLNPNPLFGGVFGSNVPLPWYWSNAAPRYIGPGISSIVNNFTDTITYPFFNNINGNFISTLSSISTGLYYSNAFLDTYRSSIISTAATAGNFIDGGSSISTLYTDFSSTFISTLEYASTLGPSVSTYSTYVIQEISSTTVPTLGGFTIGQYISTGNIALNADQNLLNFILYSTISQPKILVQPYTVFSTIVNSTLSTGISTLNASNYFPGLFKISTITSSTFIPFYASINVSTNYLGFLSVSTSQNTIFSTFSTMLPYMLGSNTINNLSTINSGISSLSTAVFKNASTLYSRIPPYITGPGVSSMTAELSTNTSVTYIDYSNTISSIITPFNAALINVNAAPGLSTLYSTAFFLNSTTIGNLSSVTYYVSSGFNKEYNAIQSTNISIINEISTNIANFISAGISSYNVSYSTFGYVSSLPFEYTAYISSQTSVNPTTQELTGAIYKHLSSFISLESTFLDVLTPFAGSTLYYQPLPIILDYSTSLFSNGDLIPRYLSRSTIFLSISTLSSLESWLSSASLDKLGIQTSDSNIFNLNIQGSASIIPSTTVINPSILMPNIQIFSRNGSPPIYNGIQTINVSSSTISFNTNNFVLKRFYENRNYAYVGINMPVDPNYSLDIGSGDARKPTGVTWITASDSRVKQDISSADILLATQQISSLRLVSYKWSEPYRSKRQLSSDRTIGFLSQEVEQIFPSSVSQMSEHGYTDFKSLDIDQLYKAKYMVTHSLLKRINNLQMRLNALMKES
jgi:hypothetical protein